MRGVTTIIIGVMCIVGGLTGRLALIGTKSGGALAAVGAGLVIWGIYRVVRSRRA